MSTQTCAKGTVDLILGPTQGQRARGEEDVVVGCVRVVLGLGQAPSLSLA